MKQERIDPDWAWAKKLNISAGVKIGNTVYLSGTVAFDSEGNVVGEGDVYAQSKQIFKNIEEALASAGAAMADVVKITTGMLRSLSEDLISLSTSRPSTRGRRRSNKITCGRGLFCLLE